MSRTINNCYNSQKGVQMKILVLENDPKEFELIQLALNGNRNTLIPLVSSEYAWQYIQSGEAHFLIANWDTSDLSNTQFIPRARALKLAIPLYIVLTTRKNLDDTLTLSGADDTIQMPFKATDLKNRIAMAERIISLSSSLAMARTQLESQPLFDNLTGFMNRAAFSKQSTGELERARRASMPLSFIAMEIDDLELINNSFGVEVGDEVLRVLSQSIREKSRPYDCIGRWIGGKFVIMLSGVIGVDAEKVAERIIAGVRGTKIEVGNEAPLGIKISAGIVSMARVGTATEIDPLIQQALQLVSRAKEAGDDQVLMVYV
jgi:diguanylate cyclase (GGDEF)-like protein